MNDLITLSLADVENITSNALKNCGASGEQLKIATASVVEAERDGIRAVGLNYLPIYCGHLRHNKLDGSAVPSHKQVMPSALQSNAANGFAHAAFVEAEDQFYRLIKTQGVAALTIVNSYSAGVVGWFVERMARQGLIGIGFANSPSAVSPAPGASPFFGTNPMAFSIPRENQEPIVADMATSQVALVTIKAAAAAGEPIPSGWGYNANGELTEDASEVINGGSLAPVGGYKGTLLGMLVDVLAGALAGPNCSFTAPMFKNNEGSYPAVGQFFLGIAPSGFGNGNESQFDQRLEQMLSALADEPGVRLPGDRRHQCRVTAETSGVEVPGELYEKLVALGQ
ncbi:MAG: Ldh family oxidoreductase [Acidiferrobacterales bacterium]|nr:Ldh family oxidoreductase [Acidiferrobacterales bacterium]